MTLVGLFCVKENNRYNNRKKYNDYDPHKISPFFFYHIIRRSDWQQKAGEHSSPLRYITIGFVGAIRDRPWADVGIRPYYISWWGVEDDAHIVLLSRCVQHILNKDVVVGSLTSTWVTAPTSLPFWIIGLPDTLMSSKGQINFVFFCGFYALFRVKGRFLHTSTPVLNLT